MNAYFACVAVALSLLGVPPAKADSNSEAAPPGILEAQTAFHYAQAAHETDDIVVARANLHKAIKCLVGVKDKQFPEVSGDPCAGRGNGAIQDVKDASIAQQLRLALGEMSLGLKRSELTTVRMHALAAMSYIQPAGMVNASAIATDASAPSRQSAPSMVELGAGDALSLQLRGAVVTGVGGNAIGTITDLVLDTQSHTVSLVGLDANGRERTVRAFYWKQLGLSRTHFPGSRYAGRISATRLESAPRFIDEVRAQPSYIDVYGNLIGRTVLAGDGKAIGRLADLAIDLRSGRVDFVIVAGSDAGTRASQSQFVLRWADISNLVSQRDIVLKLDEVQVASAPRFLSR